MKIPLEGPGEAPGQYAQICFEIGWTEVVQV